MSYRFAYPNGGASAMSGYGIDPALMPGGYSNMYNSYRRSDSPDSFSSDDDGSEDSYEYRGRLITRETRCPRDIVRAPTPPPIIKRVVERAPTPEPTILERVIIRPQAQEIVERVIEQPRTPPPRIVQKEMQEEAPPPIVRTRVIKVDRPMLNGLSQPGSPFCLPSYSNSYAPQSMGYPNVMNNNIPSFSSASSFEYGLSGPINQPAPMMMMPPPPQPMGMMPQQQQQLPQLVHRSIQMQPPSIVSPPNFMRPMHQQMFPFGQQPIIPSGMPMMAGGNTLGMSTHGFPMQSPLFNPMGQQVVY